MEPQTKAAGYVRVSTAGQADEGESISIQKQQIQDFVQQRGWQLTNIYADEGISGTKIEHRTQFQQMIQDAKQGQFSVIVFTKLSRFARNAREYQNLGYELEQQGVQLASIKENMDPTTKTGKMIAAILAFFAEWEYETIREQMHENRMIRRGESRAVIGRPPFGYTWNKEKRALVINESKAEIFRRIVRMYIEQRMSYRDICIRLNADGVESKRAAWSGAALGFILKNPAYYGHYVLNQYEYEYSGRGAGTKRSRRRKPMSETITFEIPPLIAKTRWDEIQQTTQFNKVKSKHAEAATDFFLRDILVCGRCGAKVKPRIESKKQDGSVHGITFVTGLGQVKSPLKQQADTNAHYRSFEPKTLKLLFGMTSKLCLH